MITTLDDVEFETRTIGPLVLTLTTTLIEIYEEERYESKG